jgi:hypothetical protein
MRPPMVSKAYVKNPHGALVSRESYSPYNTQNNESPQKTPDQYSPER